MTFHRRFAVAALMIVVLLASYLLVIVPTSRQAALCGDALLRRRQVMTLESQGRGLWTFDLNDANNAVNQYCR